AINFASATTAVGTTPVLDNSGTITANKGSTVLVAGALTPGAGQFGIINRSGATISSLNSSFTALDVQAAVGGGIDNAGTIRNSSGGFAITSTLGLTNTLTNESTGTIVGDVQIAQGTFNIKGGELNGATTGENASTVNFTTAAISTVNQTDFNPIFDQVG